TNQRATKSYFCPGTNCNPTIAGIDAPVGIWQYHKLDWFSTLRGRLGATVTPDSLVYATGGLAVGGISHVGTIFGSSLINGTTSAADTGFLSRATKTGWVVGAGVEAHLAGNWTGKIEYLHMDLGRDSIDAANPLNATPLAVSLNSRITDDLVRVGLNYKLDSNGSAVPGYGISNNLRMTSKAPAAAWSWAGLYLGINAGYGFGKSQTEALFTDASMSTPLFANSASSKLDGLIIGAQAGVNWQSGVWLFGLEADIQTTSQHAGPTY